MLMVSGPVAYGLSEHVLNDFHSCKSRRALQKKSVQLLIHPPKARRAGAVVATDKKITTGVNKAHAGTSLDLNLCHTAC